MPKGSEEKIQKVKAQLFAALEAGDEEWAHFKAKQLSEIEKKADTDEELVRAPSTPEQIIKEARSELAWLSMRGDKVEVERDSQEQLIAYILPRRRHTTRPFKISPEQLRAARRVIPIKGETFSSEMSTSRVTIAKWETGEAIPNFGNLLDYVEKLEDFGVSFESNNSISYDTSKDVDLAAPGDVATHADDQAERSRFEIIQSEDGHYSFLLKDWRGRTRLVSKEFPNRAVALKGMSAASKNAPNAARYEKMVDDEGRVYFVLKARNGRVIAKATRDASEIDSTDDPKDLLNIEEIGRAAENAIRPVD